MFLISIQRPPDYCEALNQPEITRTKRRRSLSIFSAHFNRNAMLIDVSALLASRAMISLSAYFASLTQTLFQPHFAFAGLR